MLSFGFSVFVFPIPDVDKMAFDRRGGCHRGRHQVRSPPTTLASFKVSIAGRSTSLTRFEFVGVHGQTHAATGFSPFESGSSKDFVQAFFLGLMFDDTTPWNNHGADVATDFVVFHDCRRRPEVFNSRVGTRADKDPVDLDLHNGCPRRQVHIIERRLN
jgi:hypothetical protein